ncbi:MAG TPA: YciI family protein [Streptosporangiaceae bacterium]
MMIHYLDEAVLDDMDTPEFDREIEAWDDEMDRRGILVGGGRLETASLTVTIRERAGEVLIADGPFAETKEQIAGYAVLECQDLTEAIEVSTRHPTVRFGAFELRPYAD